MLKPKYNYGDRLYVVDPIKIGFFTVSMATVCKVNPVYEKNERSYYIYSKIIGYTYDCVVSDKKIQATVHDIPETSFYRKKETAIEKLSFELDCLLDVVENDG